MKTIQLDLPDSIDYDNNDLKTFIAAKLFEAGKLTMSQAAELSGLTITEFMDRLGDFNVSVFNYPASDLESDVSNARQSIRWYKFTNPTE